jgi:nucleoside 2-deoxyribosyltransferase
MNKTIKRVYVAGPYSADNVLDVLKNIGRGEKACAKLFSLGYAPFCPWHDKTYVIDNFRDDFTVKQFYDFSMAWLEVSDAVVLVGDWQSSKGTAAEIERAMDLNIPVCDGIDDFLIYMNGHA